MTTHTIGALEVATTDQGDGTLTLEVIARSRDARPALDAAATALAAWSPSRSRDSITAHPAADQLDEAIGALASHLSPLAGAALRRAHALHAADAAAEQALDLIRSGEVTKAEAARVLGVTRQTIDRWLGVWQPTR